MLRSGVAFMIGLGLAGALWGDVELAPGDTLDWATQEWTVDEVVHASGGTLIFSADAIVRNPVRLAGPVNVQIASDAQVRFARKWLKENDTGKMIFDGSFAFGSDLDSTFSYLPPDSVAFTEAARTAGAKMTLTGLPTFTVMPEKWAEPVDYVLAPGVYGTLYGSNMFDVVDGRVTLPLAESGETIWRTTNPNNFAAGATVEVPTNLTLIVRRMNFNATTGSGAANYNACGFSNNLACVNGGAVRFDSWASVEYWGNITGEGHLRVGSWHSYLFHYGSLAEMTPSSTLTLESGWSGKLGNGPGTRLSSSFPGRVTLNWSQPTNVVSIGFATPDATFETNTVYRLGALKGTNVGSGGAYGSRLQYNGNQRIEIGTLSGEISAFASEAYPNSCELAIGLMSGDAKLYIKNGLRLTIGATYGWPEINYMNDQVSSNSITIADGVFINRISIPAGREVYLFGSGSVGVLTGQGTLVVAGGKVRVGWSEESSRIIARDGAMVTCGGGEDLDELLQEKAALWLDASATENMVGAWNAGWAASTATGGGDKVLAHCPATVFNGAMTATWTNGFPLIEKWFDKRPSQRLNYGWQDRCVNYSFTLYTLVYPYLVPNGLNGRAYMSFGEHGETDLEPDVYGLSAPVDNTSMQPRRERRRMPFMQDMKGDSPEGHAIVIGTAILVFGSQNGGGRAFLGGYKGDNEDNALTSANGRANWTKDGTNPQCSSHFYRGGTGYALTNAWLAANTFDFFVDSRQVDPTVTPPSGGWQVIALNGKERAARSLGMSKNFTMAGGQNYAEVLIFENELTTRERRTIEGYLAQKWNLPGGCPIKGSVIAEAGTTVCGHVMQVSGAGTWQLDSPDASPALDGEFAGDVALAFTYSAGAVSPLRTLKSAAGQTRGTVIVDFATPPRLGSYPLVQGTAVTNFVSWSLEVRGDTSGRICSLAVVDGTLLLDVRNGGTMLLVR
ncbi:MAG: hypothetical protein ACI4Q3_03610 [Kiritimatiellia bacterium]